jgi:hypothetical protein
MVCKERGVTCFPNSDSVCKYNCTTIGHLGNGKPDPCFDCTNINILCQSCMDYNNYGKPNS